MAKAFRVAWLVLVLVTPVAAAGSIYQYGGTWTPTGSSPLAQQSKGFSFFASPGDRIDASIIWAGLPADLDVFILEPGETCPITPDVPGAVCASRLATERTKDAACADRHPAQVLLSGRETRSLTVTQEGIHTVSVRAAAATYRLNFGVTIATSAPTLAVTGPTDVLLVGTNPVCKL